MDDLIDYSGASTEDVPDKWTSSSFREYFIDTYHKIHRVGGAVPWTLKEQALLSTMYSEFTQTDLADMVLYWHISTHKSSVASRFVNFYSNRVDLYHKMKKASSDYSWD